MIGKIQKKQSDFRNTILYNEKKVKDGKAELLETNLLSDTTEQRIKELHLNSSKRPTIRKPAMHASLNLALGENVSNEIFIQMAHEYMKGLGYNDNPYLIYRHTDSEHQHIHLIICRIRSDGTVVPDGKEIKKSQEITRAMEKKYGLRQLDSKNKSKTKPISKGQIEKFMRTGEVPVKAQIPVIIDKALEATKTLESFTKHLQYQGVNIQLHTNKKGIFGISYEMDGVKFKGSQLGKAYTWKNIKNQFNHEQIRLIENISSGGSLTTEQAPDGPGRKITGYQLLEHRKNERGIAAHLQEYEGFGVGTPTGRTRPSQDFENMEGNAHCQSADTSGTPKNKPLEYIPPIPSDFIGGGNQQRNDLGDADEDELRKNKKRRKGKKRGFSIG